MLIADEIAARMRAAPGLGVAYVNAPARLAAIAEAKIEAARESGSTSWLLAGHRLYRGAVMAAVLMSRPIRGHHLHEALIRDVGRLASNLERLPGGALRLGRGKRGAKNGYAYAVTLHDGDAEILRQWLDVYRADYMEIAGIDPSSPYLLPGSATPKRSSHGTPMPPGARSRESIRADWHAASSRLGYPTTPHNCRHIIAILTLARRPGDYGRVGTILGITKDTARERYGRDNGERASEQVRAALLAEHGDVLGLLGRRLGR